MIVSVCYLLLFLFVGLLLARRAVPDADSAVLLPLGDVGGGTGHGRPGQWRNGKYALCTKNEGRIY